MKDSLRFITYSALLAVVFMKATSGLGLASVTDQELADIPTIWQPPSLDERAGWCKRDKQCQTLAEAIVYEARGEIDTGKYAVAWVIRNRAEAKRWPDSIRKVILQYRQFSYLQDKHTQKAPTEKDWTTAYIVGYDVLNDQIQSPVQDATHYHSIKVYPKWAKELEVVARIDNHIFYR